MALNKDRNTPIRDGDKVVHPVAAATIIYAGSLVALNATGNAVPGATATTLIAAGRADERIDNRLGADGALLITVRRGTFRFFNYSGDLIGRTEIGKSCYIVDDQTVAKTSATNTRSVAGKVIDVDPYGVWVEIK